MRFTSPLTAFLALAATLSWESSSFGQITGISVETYVVHDGSVDPSLDGYTTYRVYAELSSDLDFVSAVFGDASDPLMLGCTGTIYQSIGATFDYALEINPLFFATFPAWEYDSWLTIGVEDANGGVNVQNTADTMAPALTLFNTGSGFVIDDPIGASWFTVFPCGGGFDLAACADGVASFAGADNRVLLAQITATGDVYGLFNVQVFPAGVQADQQVATGLTFSSNASDVFGCTNADATNYDATATIDDLSCILPCALSLELTNVITPTCNGDNDALIQVSATGAQGADYYFRDSIPAGGIEAPTTVGGQNFGNFGSLLAGTYTVFVVDAAGCTDSLEVEVPVTEVITVSAELSQGVSCNGESDAVLSIVETTGGNGEYEYYISNNPTVITDQTEWTGLSGGQALTVYAIDGNTCWGNSNLVVITDPTPISVGFQTSESFSVVDASCADIEDGLIYLVAFGGVAPTTLQFSADGENYGPSPIMVSGGTYTITAQNANGCIGTMPNEVTVGPEPIIIDAVVVPESCSGSQDGQVFWTPSGTQGSFYSTFNGSDNSASEATDLAPGDYVLTVTDDAGCSEEMVVTVESAPEIALDAVVTDASCFGENDGTVTLYADGGTGTFQYSNDGNNFSFNNTIDNLPAGAYTFFAQDENECVRTIEAIVSEPDAIVVSAIVCEDCLNGEGWIDVTVLGGSLPYTYEWIGPGVSGQDGQDIEGISTGAYTIEVTDGSGCSVTESFNITTIAEGCTDPAACNYLPNASSDDGSCDYSCYGCTDPEALNYVPSATLDDGSCFYFDPSCENIGDAGWEMFETGVYPGTTEEREFGVPTTVEFALHLADLIEEPASGQIFSVGSFSPENVVGLPSGLALVNPLLNMGPFSQQCVELQGVPAQEGVFQVQVTGTLTILVFGAPYSISDYAFTQSVIITPNVNGIPGCMYSFATNYNVIATYDDGSCYIEGCADPVACNYNSFVSVDTGVCDYTCLGCTYPEASNFASSATLDDGSCEFAGGACVFDTNGDQYVGSEDLLSFLTAYGTTCP